ncbi:ABC transporter permease [Candidatus Halobonum tyrrellensis]|uniref:ABC-type transport system permease protein (Probable substrate macrolides) n=1 Tax=Candidatus Halobonum tyrrellensis G22 TaxID=1324957 RepID=V4HD80_9EURY|nr:ABC transporter permease [Candidatus Halobonum tyrrellensis]ESP88023.1 ABC-type transport system permease protein (probable substrate macrolides) [Candidatus Halobonum tyrrellensis G22]
MSVAEWLWRFPSALMAWRNLGRNKVRTGLAALGIVIGVVAIASLGMAGAAIQQQATADLGSIGNQVTVSTGEDSDTDGLTDDQVEGIRSVSGDATVVPQKSNFTRLTARNGDEVSVSVTALTNASAMYEVWRGEAPERLQSGALIGNATATRLGLELGDPVEYDGQLYRVRGIIESQQGGFGSGGSTLVLPLSALRDQEYYDSVTILTDGGEEATAVSDAIEARFNPGDEEVLSVTNFGDIQQQVGSFLNTLNLALLGIGSISLVVASVAILNVMLMSTIERRGEIGVLRAVGIRRGEVLRMILTEALLLGVIGGLVGALLSLGVGLLMFDVLADDATQVLAWSSSRYLLYGFLFAVVASLLSGLYPAWKAANDRPVDSLRG